MRLMLADNRIFELGMTDTGTFEEIIKELDGDIDVPGWDEDLLETLNASVEDTLAEVENYGVFSEPQISSIEKRRRSSISLSLLSFRTRHQHR